MVDLRKGQDYSEKTWSFKSRVGVTGINYIGGHYEFGSTHDDFSPAMNFGTANKAEGARFFVVLGEITVDELTITVTGTSITDAGVRTGADTETIVIPNAAAADTYYETTKKWIGQISVEATAGTAKNCNYGFCKYWDNNNSNFRVVGFEATWIGGANDATPNFSLRHHKTTGWTYNAGAEPTPPTALADMNTDYNTEIQVRNNESGAWKRDNLNTIVEGVVSEGTIIEIETSVNNSIQVGSFLLRIAV